LNFVFFCFSEEIRVSLSKYIQQQREIAERMPYRLFIHWNNRSSASSSSSSSASSPEPIGPVEVPYNATIADIRAGVVRYLLDPLVIQTRGDLLELIEVAVVEQGGLAALKAHRASRRKAAAGASGEDGAEGGEVADSATADAAAQRRIKFVAGAQGEVDNGATLQQLAADGRLQRIEMRIEAAPAK
jgi:hypothetical protein